MAHKGVVAGGGRLADRISIGVLASSVPRDAVGDAIAAAGRRPRRSDGKLPPHVMVYFAMAMALFSDDDYEEVAARLAGTLTLWGCWDDSWSVPTSGDITQARQRLGHEPLQGLFAQVAVPVAGQLTRGAFLGGRRLMAIDGFEWDAPDSRENAAAFGYAGGGTDRPAFPEVRVVTVSECVSRAVVDAEIGPVAGAGSGEQAMARRLRARLEADWLLIADRGFCSFRNWAGAAASGAALLWRVKADLVLPVVELLPDGSCSSGAAAARAPRQGPPPAHRGSPRRSGPGRGRRRDRPGRGVRRARPRRRRKGRADRPGHHHHRPRGGAGAGARGGLPPAVSVRREEPVRGTARTTGRACPAR
jgi:Insertion element 4 transposase N-terminal